MCSYSLDTWMIHYVFQDRFSCYTSAVRYKDLVKSTRSRGLVWHYLIVFRENYYGVCYKSIVWQEWFCSGPNRVCLVFKCFFFIGGCWNKFHEGFRTLIDVVHVINYIGERRSPLRNPLTEMFPPAQWPFTVKNKTTDPSGKTNLFMWAWWLFCWPNVHYDYTPFYYSKSRRQCGRLIVHNSSAVSGSCDSDILVLAGVTDPNFLITYGDICPCAYYCYYLM